MKKSRERLFEELGRNLRLHFFDEEEIANIFTRIAAFGDPFGDLEGSVLALCLQLSNTSSDLVERILGHIKKASLLLAGDELERWLQKAFDLLDSSGLDAAVGFLEGSGPARLEAFRVFSAPAARLFGGAATRLETYLTGLSGMDFRVFSRSAPGLTGLSNCYTDGRSIFLPDEVKVFNDARKNIMLYRLMAAHKWAQVEAGTLEPFLDFTSDKNTAVFLSHFPAAGRRLAMDLYNILEAIRLDGFLKDRAPGLFEKTLPLRIFLLSHVFNAGSAPSPGKPASGKPASGKTAFVEGLFELYLAAGVADAPYKVPLSEKAEKTWRQAQRAEKNKKPALSLLFDIYLWIESFFTGDYTPVETPIIGVIRPEEVRREAMRQALEKRKRLIEVSGILEMPGLEPDVPSRKKVKGKNPFRAAEPGVKYLSIRGKLIELDDDLLKGFYLGRPGAEDLFPGGVLVDGAAAGGRGVYRLGDFEFLDETAAAEEGQEKNQESKKIKYDEWDFRRGGYRKGWCTLYEREGTQGHEPFVEQTLTSYGGSVTALRNRFELLRREPKLLRRQKDGDDVDLDAMVEAIADMKAGRGPDDARLFTRYELNERDVAVLFLLDMSGSTKGWVNQAVKESVVLMCEALAVLGDRYAVCGFSGMTRGRCDFYRIKNFAEDYGAAVKKRISGIEPKDYTRMGPAIRHSVSILGRVEARTRLLIVLSDGKPEDYDQYKGEYGIEDTRKALLEARQRGLHPFCVTIDTQAQSYLPRMYGDSGYVVIDNVKKLPDRIPEIYRRLTA